MNRARPKQQPTHSLGKPGTTNRDHEGPVDFAAFPDFRAPITNSSPSPVSSIKEEETKNLSPGISCGSRSTPRTIHHEKTLIILAAILITASSFAQNTPTRSRTSRSASTRKVETVKSTNAIAENITLQLKGDFQRFVLLDIELTGTGPRFSTDLMIPTDEKAMPPSIISFESIVISTLPIPTNSNTASPPVLQSRVPFPAPFPVLNPWFGISNTGMYPSPGPSN